LRVDFECFPDAEQPLFRINSPVAPMMEYRITVISKYACPIRDEDSCVLKDAAGGAHIDIRSTALSVAALRLIGAVSLVMCFAVTALSLRWGGL
jgi:hypothetical protein